MPLTGKQRRRLRALAHSLEPVVQVGKEGVSDGVVTATGAALETHELVKVKLAPAGPERHEAAAVLAGRTGSELVQVLGKVILLYRRHPEEPRIEI
jgi:RNA-binding protein